MKELTPNELKLVVGGDKITDITGQVAKDSASGAGLGSIINNARADKNNALYWLVPYIANRKSYFWMKRPAIWILPMKKQSMQT